MAFVSLEWSSDVGTEVALGKGIRTAGVVGGWDFSLWAPGPSEFLPHTILSPLKHTALMSLFSCSVMSNSLWPHELQHARLLCPSLSPGVCSILCPSSRWCHPTISSYVIPFSSCLRSFPVSQLFTSGSWSILCIKFGEWVPPQMGTRDGRWRDTNLNKMLFKIFNRIYLQIMTERCF